MCELNADAASFTTSSLQIWRALVCKWQALPKSLRNLARPPQISQEFGEAFPHTFGERFSEAFPNEWETNGKHLAGIWEAFGRLQHDLDPRAAFAKPRK